VSVAIAAPTFESMVNLLLASGFKRSDAEREVRRQYPQLVARVAAAEDERQLNLLEKDEQAFIFKLFRGFGVIVYNLSQSRATKQTPGLPDMYCMHPGVGRAWWFETKRAEGGRLSEVQKVFIGHADQCRVDVHVGDRRVAARVLLDYGIARVDASGVCGIVPFHDGR
jgi:hypothetical protein